MRIAKLALVAAAVGLVGCSDDGTGPGDENGIVGLWSAIEWTIADPTGAFSIDLVAQGAAVTVDIRADDTFTVTTVIFGQTESSSGTVAVNGSTVTMTDPVDGPMTFNMTMSGTDRMTLTSSGELWDLDQDGQDDMVDMTLVLLRS